MMYLQCNTCGVLIGQAKDGFESAELMKVHRAECQPDT